MSSIFSLKNKHAVVTGGGSGIGKSIAVLFASQGATVHVLDLTEEASATTLDEIKQAGGQAHAYACNVADEAQVDAVFAAINQIDILVNNAGISHIGNIENTSVADMDKVYNVNIKGVFLCTKAALPALKKKGGAILNLASIASMVGIADRFAYSMSKGAALLMTLSVAKDYINDGIRCNCISPGRVHTPFVDNFLQKNYPGQEEEMFKKLSASQPIGRMGKPSEIAALALYLCSDEAQFITGANYPIDGGFTGLR